MADTRQLSPAELDLVRQAQVPSPQNTPAVNQAEIGTMMSAASKLGQIPAHQLEYLLNALRAPSDALRGPGQPLPPEPSDGGGLWMSTPDNPQGMQMPDGSIYNGPGGRTPYGK